MYFQCSKMALQVRLGKERWVKVGSQKRIEINKKDLLGFGGFGKVYAGRFDDIDVAVKRLEKDEADKSKSIKYRDEIKIISASSHKNVVKYYFDDEDADEDEDYVYIVLERAHCSLSHYMNLEDNKHMSLHEKLTISYQATSGVEYLHGKGILHRDIKTDNFLLQKGEKGFQIKITDFGISKTLNLNQTSISATISGTFGYKATEVLNGLRVRQSSDIFSLGIVFHQMQTGGKHPFGVDPLDKEKNIKDKAAPDLSQITCQAVECLVRQMISHENRIRPSAANVKNLITEIFEMRNLVASWSALQIEDFLDGAFPQDLPGTHVAGETLRSTARSPHKHIPGVEQTGRTKNTDQEQQQRHKEGSKQEEKEERVEMQQQLHPEQCAAETSSKNKRVSPNSKDGLPIKQIKLCKQQLQARERRKLLKRFHQYARQGTWKSATSTDQATDRPTLSLSLASEKLKLQQGPTEAMKELKEFLHQLGTLAVRPYADDLNKVAEWCSKQDNEDFRIRGIVLFVITAEVYKLDVAPTKACDGMQNCIVRISDMSQKLKPKSAQNSDQIPMISEFILPLLKLVQNNAKNLAVRKNKRESFLTSSNEWISKLSSSHTQ